MDEWALLALHLDDPDLGAVVEMARAPLMLDDDVEVTSWVDPDDGAGVFVLRREERERAPRDPEMERRIYEQMEADKALRRDGAALLASAVTKPVVRNSLLGEVSGDVEVEFVDAHRQPLGEIAFVERAPRASAEDGSSR